MGYEGIERLSPNAIKDDAELTARLDQIDQRILLLLEALESRQEVMRLMTENLTMLTKIVCK